MTTLDDNHNSDAEIDLAGEYVLGTLDDEQRIQFENSLQSSLQLRRDVRDWQERLYVLNEGITPIKPPKRVWQNIQSRVTPASTPKPLLQRLSIWRALSTVMTIALAVVIIQTYQPEKISPLPEAITILSNEQSQAGWLVQRIDSRGNLSIKAMLVNDPGDNKDYELWMLPADGQPPKSLGLLVRVGTQQLQLNSKQLQVLNASNALAVSLEPTGGSPTGLPTGPVLYRGKLLSL